jgi:hypothetical protein
MVNFDPNPTKVTEPTAKQKFIRMNFPVTTGFQNS